ncbi:C-GCAxxG-C-C family protein [Geobacter sp. DSM 9736]|uniref:C-GCAxxG-C-C family protein n=1 Tax=Geobacter sp. DSM 9736 TaxID=1277350 RepID=UPI000B5040BB|nr:C-GCAxxG-C-C family protein [Geobacter sp. DSM 9736]SNB47078.1 C_GCAxxG_C_C family probable redox protein [Geobacter sp. DSM 9736]
MFLWRRKAETEDTAETDFPTRVGADAEGYFRTGKMHCAEAVLYTIRNHFSPETPEDVVRLAAGFGGGSGSGCICGAVSGGTMAIGLVLGGDKKKVNVLTRELHIWFKERYGSTCCRIITTGGKKICPSLTGSVAGKVAELLRRG